MAQLFMEGGLEFDDEEDFEDEYGNYCCLIFSYSSRRLVLRTGIRNAHHLERASP